MPYKDPEKRKQYYRTYMKKWREENKETCKKYREKRKEKQREYDKEYYSKNKEKQIKYSKEWREKNIERAREYDKEYYYKNKKKKSEYKKEWRKKNVEYMKKKKKEYYHNNIHDNIQFKLSHRLRNRLYFAIRNNQKAGSAVDDLGCTIEELKIHLENQFQEGMTWENWKHDGWHIDHIKPLSKFDLTDPVQFKEAVHYTNLQPLWWNENLQKRDKWVDKG